jgi:hypothetical protein
MKRYQQRMQCFVRKGDGRAWWDAVVRLNAVCRANGHQPFEVWTQTVGAPSGEMELITYYDSLDDWQQQWASLQADEEAMSIARQGSGYEDRQPVYQLWELDTP